MVDGIIMSMNKYQEDKMAEDEMILAPDPARIVEGLRDTGYDFNTAMADLVDNSIAANATLIKVKIDMTPNGNVKAFKISSRGIIRNLLFLRMLKTS